MYSIRCCPGIRIYLSVNLYFDTLIFIQPTSWLKNVNPVTNMFTWSIHINFKLLDTLMWRKLPLFILSINCCTINPLVFAFTETTYVSFCTTTITKFSNIQFTNFFCCLWQGWLRSCCGFYFSPVLWSRVSPSPPTSWNEGASLWFHALSGIRIPSMEIPRCCRRVYSEAFTCAHRLVNDVSVIFNEWFIYKTALCCQTGNKGQMLQLWRPHIPSHVLTPYGTILCDPNFW